MANVILFLCFCVGFVSCQFGFFPQRDDRRYGASYGYNFLPNTQSITDTLTAILQLRPEERRDSPYVFPFNTRPGITNARVPERYNPQNGNQYGYRPNYEVYHQNMFDNPVSFPNSNPSQVNFVNNYNEPDPPINSNYDNKENTGENSNQDYIPVPNEEVLPPYEQNPKEPTYTPNSKENHPPKEENTFPIIAPNGQNDNLNQSDAVFNENTDGNLPIAPNNRYDLPINQNDNSNTSPSEPSVPNVPLKGIPNSPPVNFDNKEPEATQLPELTPVPEFEKRNNFNFGSAGLFKESCQTVDNGVGSCISLLECSQYLKIVKDSRNNPNAVQLLRKAHCGFEGNNPKVCCPRPGIPSERPTTTTTTTTTPAPEPSGKTVSDDLVASLPEPPVCGVSNASFSRVVGGVNAKLGDFPWMALLGYKNRRGDGARWLCGGSLITSKHVLTAAHCIHNHEDDLFLVRLGELNLERDDEGATPVDVPIKSKIKHQEYSPTAFTSDIGILVLENEVAFTHLIKPICIPKDSELRARSFENYNPIIAGWGDTEFRGPSATHLQALQLPVVGNDFCKQAYSAYKQQKIDERVLCAGYKKGGKDACQGDSGGPLMQPIWNDQDYTTHFYQIGVVSFGRKCAEAGFPGVYSRVTHFVPWIESTVLGESD